MVAAALDVVNNTRLADLETLSERPTTEAERANYKLSCKGVNRRTNRYTPYHYVKSLRDERPVSGTNYSFTFRNAKLYRTRLVKAGLNSCYWKRKVLPNRYETEMLDEPVFEANHVCDACDCRPIGGRGRRRRTGGDPVSVGAEQRPSDFL